MYEVRLHPKVAKLLDSMDSALRERVKTKLRDAANNPFQYLEHYEGKDYYKLRIGDYRTLVDIGFANKILYVRVLDKRGRIYKRKR